MANEFKHLSVGGEITQAEYEAVGGHVLDSQAIGDIIYASSTSQLTRLGIGSTGAVLTVTGGIPAWDTTWTPTGHLIPASDDTYDLGSASAAWQDLFLEGDITLTDAGTISTTAGSLSITPASGSAIVLDTSTTLDGGVLTFTPSTDDTVVMTAATNGAFSLVTTDNAAAAANIQITADGTVDIDSAGVLTLDSGAAINIEPASGSAILLDGTISIDAGVVTGATSITSTAFVGDITGDVTGNADTATLATTVTATANNSTDETVYPTFVDGATSAQGIETDTGLTYNPSTGVLTSTTFTGNLTGNVTGNTSGTAATVTTAAQTNITSLGTLTALTVSGLITANGGITFADGDDITFTGATGTNDIVLVNGLADALSITDGSADVLTISTAGGTNTVAITGDLTVSGTIAADTATTASVATTVTITDNESTDEANAIIFTAGGDLDGGNLGLESDGTLNYNPSSGTLTTTTFAGALTGNADTATALATTRAINGVNFDGSAAITVTAAAGTLSGDTLKSTVVTSSLTAVGTIATGVWQGTAIASGYIAADAITGAKIADDAIDSEHYADGSIDNQHIANGTIALAKTAITAGTNLTIATNALNVDDAFLTNTGDDTTDGTITAAGFTTGNDGVLNFSDDLPSTDHKATGVTVTITSSAAIAAGVPVYISGAGTVAAADADAASTMPAIGINTTDLSGGAGEAEILLLGIWHDETYAFTAGADVFIGLDPASSTAASDVLGITTTAPTGSGDTVQKVGVVLTADTVFVNFTGTEVLLA